MDVPLKAVPSGPGVIKLIFILIVLSVLTGGMELMQEEEVDSEYIHPISESAYTTTFIHEGMEYILSSTKTTWNEARFICKSSNSTLAILDDFSKALYLAEALAETDHYMDSVWIGSRKDDETNNFYWITSRKAVPRSQNNMWNVHQVQRPIDENSFPVWINRTDTPVPESGADCVALQRGHHDEPIFLDLYCNAKRGFACEKHVTHEDGFRPEEVMDIRCDSHNYRIFAAEANWEEAVGTCNSHGMSLATFDNLRCVEKVGIKMMKMRPALENAWIGGKGDDGEWSWVSTGQLISNSGIKNSQDPLQERWPPFRDHVPQKTQGCLLLDRHVCKEPIFLEARCDRQRNFICQYEDNFGPHLVADDFDVQNLHEDTTHYYVLVPQPLPYESANKYCHLLNGSLASVTDKDVMTHLLLAMGEPVQDPVSHIWVAGNLDQNAVTGELQWKDPNTGYPLPGPEDGLLPWCEDEEIEVIDACLNLDKDSPLEGVIYGLPCDTRQPFICTVDKVILTKYSMNWHLQHELPTLDELARKEPSMTGNERTINPQMRSRTESKEKNVTDEITSTTNKSKLYVDEDDILKVEHTFNPEEIKLASDEKPVSPEESRLTSDDKHVSPEESKSTSDEKHVSPEESRLASDEKHVSPEESRLASNEKHVSPEESRLASDDKHVSPEESRLASDEKRASPEESKSISDEKLVSPEESRLTSEENVSPEESKSTSDEKHVSPEESRLASVEKHVSPEESKSISDEKHVSPEESRLTSEENVSPEESKSISDEKHVSPEELRLASDEKSVFLTKSTLAPDGKQVFLEDPKSVFDEKFVVPEESILALVEKHIFDNNSPMITENPQVLKFQPGNHPNFDDENSDEAISNDSSTITNDRTDIDETKYFNKKGKAPLESTKPTESPLQLLTTTQSETNKNSLEQTTKHYENIHSGRRGKDENLQTMTTERNDISLTTENSDIKNNPVEVTRAPALNEPSDPKANLLQFPIENNDTDENLPKPITELDKTDSSTKEYKFKARLGDLSKITDNNISNMTVYNSQEPDSTQAMTTELYETKQTTERNENLENLPAQVTDRSEQNENPLELAEIVKMVENLKTVPNEQHKTVENQVTPTAENIEMVEELQAPTTEYIKNNDRIHKLTTEINEIMKAKTENIDTNDGIPELKTEIDETMKPATEYDETKDRILELTTEINEIMEPTTKYIETNERILEMTTDINEIIEKIHALTTERFDTVDNSFELTTKYVKLVKTLQSTTERTQTDQNSIQEHPTTEYIKNNEISIDKLQKTTAIISETNENSIELTTETIDQIKNLTVTASDEKIDDTMGALNAKTQNVETLVAEKNKSAETRENSEEIENSTVPMSLYRTTEATTHQTNSAQELTIGQSEKIQPLTTDQIQRLNETVDNESNHAQILTSNQKTFAEEQTTDQIDNLAALLRENNENIPITDNDTIAKNETTAVPEEILTTKKPPESTTIYKPSFRTVFRQKKPFIPPFLGFGRRKLFKPQRPY